MLAIQPDCPWRQCQHCPYVKVCQYQTQQVGRHQTFFRHNFTVAACTAVGTKTTIKAGHSDSLRAGRSGDRIPAGAGFSAPVQTGPGAHLASYTMGTGSFLGVKRSGRGADPTPI
jgi:hypothetical protein